MVRLLPVLVGFGAVLSLIGAATIDYYASKYDHIDVDTILNNRRMVNYYTACLLSNGPCPPEGVEFKRILPEALRTNCVRCTEKQKTITLRTIKRLQKEYPKIWAQLKEQWDPDDLFVAKFEATFGVKQPQSIPEPEQAIQIGNRFGATDNQSTSVENVISQIFTSPLPSSSTSSSSSSTTTTTAKTTTSSTVSTSRMTTSTTTRKTSAINTTNRPNINTISASAKPTKRPRPDIGASIQATVEVVKTIEQMVNQFAREKLQFFNRLLTG